jgi:coniferyl-aldehyde dehydrogenase
MRGGTPDYVLLPEGREAAFEAEARRAVSTLYPALAANTDYTRIVSQRHYDRLLTLVQDAAEKGARIVPLAEAVRVAPDDRLLVPTLVFSPDESMLVMREEIFGPILPVVTYRTLDEAIGFVNARPRPLALYYFDENEERVDHVLANTLSGGVTINDCIVHLGQHNLPFGGVGQSGMGQYHGFDGFATFSKKRGVMVQRRWAGSSLFRAPFGGRERLMNLLLRVALRSK